MYTRLVSFTIDMSSSHIHVVGWSHLPVRVCVSQSIPLALKSLPNRTVLSRTLMLSKVLLRLLNGNVRSFGGSIETAHY